MSQYEQYGFYDLNVECVHRERQPDLVTFADPGTPACDACSLAHAKALLQDAARDLKWAKEGVDIDRKKSDKLEKNKLGWARRGARLQAERDEADRNAGRMQREIVTLKRALVEDAIKFVNTRMLPPEPAPGPARRDWYVDNKEPTDKLLQWLKNWSTMRPYEEDGD